MPKTLKNMKPNETDTPPVQNTTTRTTSPVAAGPVSVIDPKGLLKDKPVPGQAPFYQLTNEELLKLKNVNLQRQIHDAELRNLDLQEILVVRTISERVGEDTSNWKFDVQRGILIRPTQNTPPQKVPAPTEAQ